MKARFLSIPALGAATFVAATFGVPVAAAIHMSATYEAPGSATEPVQDSALPACAFDVVVIAPSTDLRCDVRSYHRLDMVGIGQARCNDLGGNWGSRLQRCFNIGF